MQQALIELGLENVEVKHKRVEEYHAEATLDTIVCRAFATDYTTLKSTDHLITQGRIILMLGKQNQIPSLPTRYNVLGVHAVSIPNLHACRHIAVLEKI